MTDVWGYAEDLQLTCALSEWESQNGFRALPGHAADDYSEKCAFFYMQCENTCFKSAQHSKNKCQRLNEWHTHAQAYAFIHIYLVMWICAMKDVQNLHSCHS